MLGYKMKIFIDSADINEIKSLNDTGLENIIKIKMLKNRIIKYSTILN